MAKKSTDISDLLRRVESYVEDYATVKLSRVFVRYLYTVVLATPFLSGMARNNYFTFFGDPPEDPPYERSPDTTGSASLQSGLLSVKGWKPFSVPGMETLSLGNYLDYIEDLDSGVSASAPDGMTAGAFEAAMEEAKKKLLSGTEAALRRMNGLA